MNPLTTGVKGMGTPLPLSIKLEQNYPNPFNPMTQISFTLPKAMNVELVVSDVIGRHVATLVKGERLAGNQNVTFDAKKFGLASGIYIYTIKTPDGTVSKKMNFVQ